MTCNNKHDIPEYVGAMAEVNDTFKDIIFKQANAEGKFLKLGSALNVLQAGVHAKHGEWENFFQDIGVWAATAALSAAIAPMGIPAIIGTAVLSFGFGLSLNYMIDKLQCPDPDPTEPYRPRPDESPTQGYIKKYYDPIILDLDGNGVGMVSKFGVLFMMSGGAMFDHDGNGIATQAGWVAVNDEWWEMVV